jgi:hypothetical protein
VIVAVPLPPLGSCLRQAAIALWAFADDVCPADPGWTPCCFRQAWSAAKAAEFPPP